MLRTTKVGDLSVGVWRHLPPLALCRRVHEIATRVVYGEQAGLLHSTAITSGVFKNVVHFRAPGPLAGPSRFRPMLPSFWHLLTIFSAADQFRDGASDVGCVMMPHESSVSCRVPEVRHRNTRLILASVFGRSCART